MALLAISDRVLQLYNHATGHEPLVRSFLDKMDKMDKMGQDETRRDKMGQDETRRDKTRQDGTRWLSGAYDPVNLEILSEWIDDVQ